MGGPAEVQLVGERLQAEKCAQEIELEARRIEKKFSRFDSESIISKINAAAAGDPVQVDSEVAGLLEYAAICFEQSDGLFDITSGVLRRAWDFKTKRVPNAQEIEALLPLIGWQKVEWRSPLIRLPLAGMQIDFGGLGKEYAVDRCVGIAQTNSINSGFVNFAGDVRVLGPQPLGRAWHVGLVHPRKENAVFASVEVSSGAVATSGDYERFFEVDGKRYCHIMNPQTGWPVHELQSVSVLAESCLTAGTASTITMLLGYDRGKDFLAELGLPYVICNEAGQVESSPIPLSRAGAL